MLQTRFPAGGVVPSLPAGESPRPRGRPPGERRGAAAGGAAGGRAAGGAAGVAEAGLLQRAMACAGARDWPGARRLLEQALVAPEYAQAARLLLWEVCQATGERDAALAHLDAALRANPLTTRPAAGVARRRVLALAVPGDFQANLPLGPLLDAETELHTLWLVDPAAVLADPLGAVAGHVPEFDCVFIAIAEDARHGAALAAADALVAALGRPSINSARRVASLDRAGAAALLAGVDGALVPCVRLATGGELGSLAWRRAQGVELPLILRPLGSHAGHGLQRADDAALLEALPADAMFQVAPFVDTRGADGLYRKCRIVFVDGVALPYHLAVHDGWAVWYYNAGMERHVGRRAEEAAFLADMDGHLPAPALTALAEIGRRVGLDYFGLDCAVLGDGRLMVFEVETGMLVHDDDPAPFGYRREPVRRIVRAVAAMIDRRIAAESGG